MFETGMSEFISQQCSSSRQAWLLALTKLGCPGLAPQTGCDLTLETGPGLGSEDTEDSSPCSPETHSPVGLQGKDGYQG